MNFIEETILPVFLVWFSALILVMFRGDLDLHWKISLFLCFVVYLIVFSPEWSRALDRLEEHPGFEIRNWIRGVGKLTFYFLFLLWPVTLIRIYYSVSGELAKEAAAILTGATVGFWFLFWLYFQFQETCEEFLNQTLIEYFQ